MVTVQTIPHANATEVYYTIATSKLSAQMQQIDQIDAKAATVLTFASVILAFFAGLLPTGMLSANPGLRATEVALLGLSVVAYGVLVIYIVKAYRVGDWSFRPCLTDLETNCAENDEETVKVWVADECSLSYRDNKPLIAQKASWLNNAFITLACEVGLIAVTGAIT